jgi:hypothetical protein
MPYSSTTQQRAHAPSSKLNRLVEVNLVTCKLTQHSAILCNRSTTYLRRTVKLQTEQPITMGALPRAATLFRVPVPRACATPHSLVRTFWQQATVRSGPFYQPRSRAGFSTSGFLPPLFHPPRPALHRWRGFRHLAQQPNSTLQSATATKESPPQPATSTVASITNAEQRRRDWGIIRRLVVHIWPKDDWGTRGRVILGVGLLIGGKVRRT